MTTRAEWIDEGLAVLAEQGLPGVRIDRIATRLGVSKGSFHHHFRGTADYHTALLTRYEERTSDALAEAVADSDEAVSGSDEPAGEQTLRRLAEQLPELYDPRIETAMRAWALHDDAARSVIGRVDAARLEVLTAAWSEILADPATARTAALIPLLVAIGAAAAVPPLDLPELAQVYRMLADQIPTVGVGHPGAGGAG